MHAFDYVMTLMSFVYALAIAHVLATAGDIIGAWGRVKFSWLHAAWMLFALLGVLAWWIGLWGLRQTSAWRVEEIAEFFVLAAALYLLARLVCPRIPADGPVDMPRIPADGPVDMPRFHAEEGRKYIGAYVFVSAITLGLNIRYGGGDGWSVADIVAKNHAVIVLLTTSVIGTIFAGRRVQIAVTVVVAATWMWYFATLQGALT